MEDLVNIKFFTPELIVVLSICVIFILDAIFKNFKKSPTILVIVGISSCASFLVSLTLLSSHQKFFSDSLINDGLSAFFRCLFSLIAFLSIFLAFMSKEIKKPTRSDFTVLVLSIIFGMNLMVLSSNFLILYIGVETVSIISYVLSGFNRGDLKSNEAAFKYLIFGAVASAFMLYGISITYGLTGSIYYSSITAFIADNASNSSTGVILFLSIMLIFAGLAYKISAFPFHFWTPDVYEGSPTPVATFLSVGPKLAGFGVFIRLIFEVYLKNIKEASQTFTEINPIFIIAVVSTITMFIGNLSALHQTSVKRMLAYSSISHVGYILIGFISLDSFGIKAISFYLVAYFFMNFGAFWIVVIVNDAKGGDDLSSFRSFGWQAPVFGVCMAIFLFSLTGIPMFAGFIGKFFLFSVAIKTSGYLWLAILGVINSVISLYYYLKIIKMMWLERLETSPLAISYYHTVGVLILAIPTIILGLYFSPLMNILEGSFSYLK